MGCFSRRAVFFPVARFLGLALATVRFIVAAFATLRALRRFAEVPLRNFARFCTFDRFLRLAMIVLFRLRCPHVMDESPPTLAEQGSKVMAKFVPLQIAGEQTITVYVNVDQIRYLRPGSAGRTTIHFDSHDTLVVLENPEHIAAVGGR